jgi:hypothetical protein
VIPPRRARIHQMDAAALGACAPVDGRYARSFRIPAERTLHIT